MSNTKIMGILLIIVAGYAMYLHSQDKLIPVLKIATLSPDSLEVTAQKGDTLLELLDKAALASVVNNYKGVTLWKYIAALVMYLFILSLIDGKSGMYLTLIILFGGYTYYHTKRR